MLYTEQLLIVNDEFLEGISSFGMQTSAGIKHGVSGIDWSSLEGKVIVNDAKRIVEER